MPKFCAIFAPAKARVKAQREAATERMGFQKQQAHRKATFEQLSNMFLQAKQPS